MKATLTLEGNISVLAHVLTLIGQQNGDISINHVVAGSMSANVVNGSIADDDDSGPANASAPDLDKAGIPWDERIHAKTKAVNSDGTWKKRRNRDEASVPGIEAELRAKIAAMPAPQPSVPAMPGTMADASAMANVPMPAMMPQATAPTANPGPQMPQGDNAPAPQVTAPNATLQMPANPNLPDMTPGNGQVAPVVSAPVSAPVSVPNPAPAAAPTTPGELMAVVQGGLLSGSITPDYMAQVVNEVNTAYAAHNIRISAITEVFQQPFLVEYIAQLFKRDGKIS